RTGANIGEVTAPLGCGWDGGVENLARNEVTAPLFREEEKGLFLVGVVVIRNVDGAADGIAVIVLLELWNGLSRISVLGVEKVQCVEGVVTAEIVDIAVKALAAGLGFDFHSAGSVAAVLCPVVRSEDLEFGDGIDARVNVERGVRTVVHVVAAVEFPVVVFGAAPVEAEGDVAVNADCAFVLAGLVADAGNDGGELGEVAAVQLKFGDLFAGDGAAEVRRCGLDLGNALACDDDFVSDGADGQSDVNALFFGDLEDDFRRSVFLEASCRDAEVIGVARETGDNVGAIGVSNGGASEAAGAVLERDVGAGNSSAGCVNNGAADVARILGSGESRKSEQNKCCYEKRMEQ